jgi:superfamily II DNA or RNA helicase
MKTKPTITILDAIHCKADKKARELILPLLAYTSAVWKRSRFGYKTEQVVISHLITGRQGSTGIFLTGLLPRICKTFGNKINISGNEEHITANKLPKLKHIKFRADQRKALRSARRHQRGIVLMPTGSGKTIIALGIMSIFKDHRILFLCHTEVIIEQTASAIRKHLGIEPHIIGGGHKTNWNIIRKDKRPIVLATIQSFAKIPYGRYSAFFDITIIDETHHANSLTSQYGKVMTNNLSPRRYGLTATMPTTQQEILVNEGLIGPPIAELTVQEGIEIGIIAKPIINLIEVTFRTEIDNVSSKYPDAYEYGIVRNRRRNMLIIDEIKNNLLNKETTLIIIERTKHGTILRNLLRNKNIKVKFVHGSTSKEVRLTVKNNLKKGKIKVVICSKIWKEAINIPTLRNIINACGMKEEKAVIQAIGRGLRTTKNKKTVKITDFIDPYKYLKEHSEERIKIYKKHGWL